MKYRLFTPTVSHVTIHEATHRTGHYPYNHDVSVAWFNNRFYAAWNAHPDTHAEGHPGQINVIAESTDFEHWSEPEFFLGSTAVNGVTRSDGVMWQPNLLNYKNQALWCFWCLTHSEGKSWPLEDSGTYFSYLPAGSGSRWVNVKILDRYSIEGLETLAFPSQNPFLCSNGRVLVPVTFIHAPADPRQSKHWNAALYSDDEGKSWQVSSLLSQPSDAWANWEPHFHEQQDGKIRAFMRNMNKSFPRSPNYWLLTAESKGNQIGSPLIFEKDPVFSCMETGNSRMHVFQTDKGSYCMLHHDCIADHGTYDSRYNLALFFSRTGRDDFIPATPFSRKNVISAYPQGLARDGKIYVAYTVGGSGNCRSIEGAVIGGQPDPDHFWIFPRAKDRVALDVYKDAEGITCARRLNPGFEPPRVNQIEKDGRTCLVFNADVSAAVDVPKGDPRRSEVLQFKFRVKVLSPVCRQFLVLCTLGGAAPIRIGLPANRDRLLYAFGNDQWQAAGYFPLQEWVSLEIEFHARHFTVKINEGMAVKFGNPGNIAEYKLFFGDGYDSDYLLNNQSGEFLVDLHSIATSVSADIKRDA